MRRLIGTPLALCRDAHGAVTMLAAAGMVAVMAAGALAVDLGSVYYESRRLQGLADAAALSAAGNPGTATAAAQAAITAAEWQRVVTPIVTTGNWTGDPSRTVAQRFVPTGTNVNAAQVKLTADTPLYFGRIFGITSLHIARSATAVRVDLASFSIGSRLLSLDGGMANALLSGLTGTSVSLTAADYNALLGADVDLLSYVAALKTETGVSAASFDQVLSTSTTVPHALTALQAALTTAGDTAAGAAVAKIAATAPATAILPSTLINLGKIGRQDHAAAGNAVNVRAYNLLEAIVQVAGGARQIHLDLGSSFAGLASLNATVVVGDRVQNSPWIAVTANGTPIVSTAQTRLYLQAAALGTPALAALGVASVRLPLYVELAPAQARLSSLSCAQTARLATLEVQPAIGHVAIANVNAAALSPMSMMVAESPATFVSLLGIAGVSGASRVDLSDNGWQTVAFTTAEIDAQATKTVHSGGTIGAIAASLVGELSLTATLGPLSIPSPSLAAAVKPILTTMAPLLDGALANLLDTLGIRLGQADVRVNGVRCGTAALVA